MNSASSLQVKLVLDLVTAKMLFLSWGNVGAFVLHPARQGPTPGFPYRQAKKKKFQELSSPYKQAGRSMYDEFYTSSRHDIIGILHLLKRRWSFSERCPFVFSVAKSFTCITHGFGSPLSKFMVMWQCSWRLYCILLNKNLSFNSTRYKRFSSPHLQNQSNDSELSTDFLVLFWLIHNQNKDRISTELNSNHLTLVMVGCPAQ